jgi:quercetin dioxygenase-like cupin family protein
MFAKEQQKITNYTVKNVETVAAGTDVQARLFTLAPGEVIPWHSHSEIADHFFVLDGELTVETRAPDDYRTLGIGERYQINAGHAHQTSNRGTRDCRTDCPGRGEIRLSQVPAIGRDALRPRQWDGAPSAGDETRCLVPAFSGAD